MSQFKKGQTVYLECGEMAEYFACVDGVHYVRQAYEVAGFDGETVGVEYGSPIEAKKVYASAPVEVFHQEVKKLNETLSTLKSDIHQATSELRNAEKRNTELKVLLSQNAVLEHIDDVLQGKFNFFAMPDSWGGPKIVSAEDALDQGDRWDKKLKLLSLFGDTNGDLHWQLNRYRDGSGSWEHVLPCRSIEEAQALLQRHYDEQVVEWRNRSDDQKHYGIAVSWVGKSDWLVVPDDVTSYAKSRAEAEKAAQIADLQKRIEKLMEPA